jgi:D-amino-acid dehydrogenase
MHQNLWRRCALFVGGLVGIGGGASMVSSHHQDRHHYLAAEAGVPSSCGVQRVLDGGSKLGVPPLAVSLAPVRPIPSQQEQGPLTSTDGKKERVVVLGAGVVGVATAYFLARTGLYDVVVIERQPGPALETSFANGGHFCVSDFVPMTDGSLKWKVLLHQIQRIKSRLLANQENHPPPYLLVTLKGLCDPLLVWSLCLLLWRSSDEAAMRSAKGILDLALFSHQCLEQIRKEEQLNYDRGSMAGILHLYRSEAKFQVAKKKLVALKQRFGPHLKNHAVWDAEKCIFHEPSLKNSRAKISGGIWWEGNESGDCNMFTQGLADICEHKYGVTFLYSTNISTLQRHPNNPLRVSGIVTEEGVEVKADKVVVCLGSYTSQLLRHSLGLWLPIFPIKGYSLTLKLPPEGFVPSGTFPLINLADIESKTYFARLVGSQGSRLRIVGMGELCGYDPTIDRTKEGIANLTTSSTQLFPELRRHHLNEASLWACLRAVTPDSLPMIGPIRGAENVYINTGHGSMGWTLACGSGSLTASILAGLPTHLDHEFYAATRF